MLKMFRAARIAEIERDRLHKKEVKDLFKNIKDHAKHGYTGITYYTGVYSYSLTEIEVRDILEPLGYTIDVRAELGYVHAPDDSCKRLIISWKGDKK